MMNYDDTLIVGGDVTDCQLKMKETLCQEQSGKLDGSHSSMCQKINPFRMIKKKKLCQGPDHPVAIMTNYKVMTLHGFLPSK